MRFNYFSLLALLLFPLQHLFAQAGTLDDNFDGDGRLTTNILSGSERAYGIAVQPDGKIVVVGEAESSGAGASSDYAIVRYRPDGSLDPGFSLNGHTTLGIAPADDDTALDLEILPDGGILVAGFSVSNSSQQCSAMSLKSNGTAYNTGFGNNGKLLTAFGLNSAWASLARQPDGKFLLVGGTSDGSETNFLIVRLTPEGALDNSFSADGKTAVSFSNFKGQVATAVALQPDGKIVVAGVRGVQVGETNEEDQPMLVARLNANGTLDQSFSFDGKATVNFGVFGGASSVLIQPDGKIVVVGTGEENTNSKIAIARLNSDGTLDATFSGNGKRLISAPSNAEKGTEVLLQPDGKLVVIGYRTSGENKIVVARLLQDGSSDSGFGDGGVLRFDFNDPFLSASAAALTPSGRIVVAGVTGETFDAVAIAVAQILTGLNVNVTDLSQNGTLLLYPNPVENNAVFEYEIKDPGPVTLQLLDLQGRLLHTFLAEENRPVGKNMETLAFPKRFAGGLYLLYLQTESGKAMVKLAFH